MFRRIEVIYRSDLKTFAPYTFLIWQAIWECEPDYCPSKRTKWFNLGLNFLGGLQKVCGVKAPRGLKTHKSMRFFFTENGWKSAGRTILKFIKHNGWQHRVISVKEGAVDVIYRDDLQVAVRPRRRRAR